MRVLALVLALACTSVALAQVPAGRPPRAQTQPADYVLPDGVSRSVFFAVAPDGALFGSSFNQLLALRHGQPARAIGIEIDPTAGTRAVGGDGRLWWFDRGAEVMRTDFAGQADAAPLAGPALAIAADGVHTDVLESNTIESFDRAGGVHRIPLGRTIRRASIAALPNAILVAAEGVAGIIRIDRSDRVELLKLEGNLRPGTLRVVGNTVWFSLRTAANVPLRRIGRVHDRVIQTVDLATFAPIVDVGAGAADRFIAIESFDVYGVVSIAGELACERSIGSGIPPSVIAQVFIDSLGATYLTTSRIPTFVKITDACR